jgi:formyltetrahydrofolate deformylase
MESAVILMQCPDQRGIIAKISEFVFRYNGNILQFEQYSTDPEDGWYFMRLEFCFDSDHVPADHLEKEFAILAKTLTAKWNIHYASSRLKMGLLVSKYDHCLADLLYRWQSGELKVEIPFVISNHEDARGIVSQYDLPFHYIPVSAGSKQKSEAEILHCARNKADFLVLARYMQVLSAEFLSAFNGEIINIHHSFLPSFKGANPYQQAYNRGVKVIGATAHYVTENLDEGPIIEQLVERVSHRDGISALQRKGKNIEKNALANAVQAHIEHRIIRFENRTVVFA